MDVAGNIGNTVTRSVTITTVPDTTPPVVSLVGSGTITLTQGLAYAEQ